jgi:nicotinate-nucleotide--dimethylbenzimidazole phosphoribosyltransferase
VVAAGDHGVTARGVSPYPAEVTAQMVANFLAGGAAINVLADHAGARVRVVDAGVRGETPRHPALLRLRLGAGTADIVERPAMPRALAERAVDAGITLVEEERAGEGVDVLGCGEMGIGNSTSAAAIVAAATGRPASAVTGRGAGIDDAGYARKLDAVERALARHRAAGGAPGATIDDGLGLLASLGGFEIGLLAGVYLGAAAARVPAVVDGLIAGAAALVAAEIAPACTPYLVAAHRSVEPGHTAALERLGLEPLLDLGLRLGEGTGAALGITLCVAACRLLDEMATFDEAGVSDATDAVAPEG